VASLILGALGNTAWLGVAVALLLLFIALRYIVKLLKSLVLTRVERFFQRYIFRTPALGFVVGVVVTALVQSSSITTSIVVPLLGAGVITASQIYPYLLGANIGTTVTAFLASFVTGSPAAVSVAFAHLVFNVYGIAIFWPLKRIPIFLANRLANLTERSKLVPIAYIALVFFVIPGAIIYLME
jgi:sodium-dependent phosphate cotransporter